MERVGKPKSLAEAKSVADKILNDAERAEAILGSAFGTLEYPDGVLGRYLQALARRGQANAAALCAVRCARAWHQSLLLNCNRIADLISKDRPSNRADLAYLSCLPFCMVFTSNDKLHAKTARLFLRAEQEFVWVAISRRKCGASTPVLHAAT